jgi:hypothetical protein
MRLLLLCGTFVLVVLASRAFANDPAAPRDGGRPRGHRDHNHHGGGQHQREHWHHDHFPSFWCGPWTPGFLVYYPTTVFSFQVVAPPVVPAVAVNAAPANPVLPAAMANNPPAPQRDPAPRPKLKATHAEQKARAGRYIGFGDTNFEQQKYHAAFTRYQTAIEIAPDVAESFFRQAFALVALGRYEKAAAAFRRGLQIRSDWRGTPFRLDELYGGAAVAKTQHIETLARAVEANPFDADLLLVLGMQLFFDGQADRAAVFFARAAQLGAHEDHLLDDFLGKPKPADAPQPGGKISF